MLKFLLLLASIIATACGLRLGAVCQRTISQFRELAHLSESVNIIRRVNSYPQIDVRCHHHTHPMMTVGQNAVEVNCLNVARFKFAFFSILMRTNQIRSICSMSKFGYEMGTTNRWIEKKRICLTLFFQTTCHRSTDRCTSHPSSAFRDCVQKESCVVRNCSITNTISSMID